MKKVHYIAGLAGMIPVAAGFLAPAAAHAATTGGTPAAGKTVSPHHIKPAADTVFHCYSPHSGFYKSCSAPIINGATDFYSHNGKVLFQLHDGDRVWVTCWYTGTAFHGDTYKDHVSKEIRNGALSYYSGHVNDYHVNFSGLTPDGLPLKAC